MMYSIFSTENYSIAGKRGHWPVYEDISLAYLRGLEILETQTHVNMRLNEKKICKRKSL